MSRNNTTALVRQWQKPYVRFGLVPIVCLLLAFGVSYGISLAVNNQQDTPERAVAKCDGACVSLSDGVADPTSISVAVGGYVQFNAADGDTTYNLSLGEGLGGVTAKASESFKSGNFGEGEAWRVQFKEAGNYYFQDSDNPGLSILVVAYKPGAKVGTES